MAANGERDALCAGSKQKQPGEQISHDTGHLFKECVVSILDSLAEFGTKVCVNNACVFKVFMKPDMYHYTDEYSSPVYNGLLACSFNIIRNDKETFKE